MPKQTQDTPDAEPVVAPEELPAADEVAEQLRALGAKLVAVADDKVEREGVTAQLRRLLGSLKVADFPSLAEDPTIQGFAQMVADAAGQRPGEVRNRGTLLETAKEWTQRDMEQFPKVTFEPRETVVVGFNGLLYQLVDGVQATVPEPVYTIYQNHRQAVKDAQAHEDYLLGYTDKAPRHLLTDESVRVRAFSQLGPRPDPRMRGVGMGASEGEAEE